MKLTIKNARLSFPNLWEAATVNGEGAPKFSAAFIIPKDHPQVKEFRAAVEQVAKEKWPTKFAAVMKASSAKDRNPLHDGDAKAQYAGFDGNYYVSASNAVRPKIKDRDGKTDLIPSDGRPYAGCYVNVILELYAQDNKYGQHVNATLLGVQFVRDGEAFAGGGTASDDDFEDMSIEDEDDLS